MSPLQLATSIRPAGVPGAYSDSSQIKKMFTNGVDDAPASSITPADTLQLAPHPVSSTLSAEKFTEGMTPAMASVYPGKNGPAGVAGDFDKIYLPRPLVRKVHSGRPLMKGETQAKAWEPTTAESFHATIAYAPPFDATEEKPYMVPKYAPDFPLESNMDPQRMHSGYMVAPHIPTATLPAKPTSPLLHASAPPAFPADASARKLGGSAPLSDAPFHSTFTSEREQQVGGTVHLIKTHAAGAKQGKDFSDRLW
ncbi:hypothetical protein KFE25_002988 [Diacronema lutheri]|uniref:Uncharacterized protein n=1 Tax=Diacronema lutheri TaxID=2081491 RepID=A0A8J6CC35_DIALT|nr:hypothetical protein KFE25_002988 [Diacronema lutheri]